MQSFYRILFVVLFFVPTHLLHAQTTVVESFEFEGMTRDYRVYLPEDFDEAENMPLVFSLHGITSNALEQQLYTQMDAVADTERFVICYPNGADQAWNVGWLINSGVDDMAFVETLIDTLALHYNINTNRVYSCGMSNGGFMSYHLACNLPDKFAAVASVTGSMVPGTFNTCQPDPVRPILQIHGTADPTVGYNGTPFVGEPIEEVVAHWYGLNNCNPDPTITPIPDTNTADGCTAERYDYTDCDNNHMVSFIKIDGGGHTWPSGAIDIGVTNRDFSASATIWEFFSQYELETMVSNQDVVDIGRIAIFPNPVIDMLTIQIDHPETHHYRLIGMDGRLYQGGRLASNQLPVNGLPNGMYVLELNDGQRVRQAQVVKVQ